MNSKDHPRWSNGHLLLLVCVLFGAAVVFHLASAAKGHSFYRDQHLGAALVYARGHIDLLRPIIVGFNATGTPTPQEPPFWQAAAALAFKALGPWWGWANVVSLALFATSFVPLFLLAQDFFGSRAAWWTLVFFLAQPIVFVYSGTAGTDGFSLATAIWFLYCAMGLLKNPSALWWLATVFAGSLAATAKMPFFLTAGLACFFLTLGFHRNSPLPWLFLGSAAVVIGGVFFAWTHYTDRCTAGAEFPFDDLRVSDKQMFLWYFGDLHYRLSPGNWIKGAWRMLNACFGSFALVGLCGYALFFVRGNPFAKLLLLGGVTTTLIFTHLVLHHTHYYLMFAPPIAMLCGLAAADLEKKVPFASGWKTTLGLAGVLLVLGLSLLQGLIGVRVVLVYDNYPHDMAALVDQYTAPTDKLLIEGGGWGGNMLILAQRDGLSIWNTKICEDATNFARLRQLGFNKLVMISEPPLTAAVEKSNPGQTHAVRESYRQFLTPVARDWPTLFESDDILIKQIP